jgi:peptidoglycan/LPS O-acetylase OafA/YrhL
VPWRLPLNHLWTLSVEEQFYLLWPLVVLRTPARRLPSIIAGGILLSIISRTTIVVLGGDWGASQLPTPCSFDALGIGALLAWHQHTHPSAAVVRARAADKCLLLGGILVLAGTLSVIIRVPTLARLAVEVPASSLIAVWMVERCASGVSGWYSFALNARPVRYVGIISYGVYLVQSPIRYGLGIALSREGRNSGSLGLFLLTSALSIAAASLSWRYLEAPLNRLKTRIPYPT